MFTKIFNFLFIIRNIAFTSLNCGILFRFKDYLPSYSFTLDQFGPRLDARSDLEEDD